MPLIAPSLLSADFMNLEAASRMINESEADWFHLDVMDGRFVPNITFGMPIVKAFSREATKPLDVHLMIVEPERYIVDFARAGAHHLSIHLEASPHLHRSIQMIKAEGMKAGVAINPHSPIHLLEDVIEDIDIICMMSVNPGFGGQRFIHNTLSKIQTAKQMILESGSPALIEIDGGVTLQNAAQIMAAGADVLVAGNTVFGAEDPKWAIQALKNIH